MPPVKPAAHHNLFAYAFSTSPSPKLSDKSRGGHMSGGLKSLDTMNPRRIGFLGYDDVQTLDIVGPVDAFMAVRPDETNDSDHACYETLIIGLSDKPFVSESGVTLKPHCSMKTAPALDTLIVPGGRSLRVNPRIRAKISEWIELRAAGIRRIASVCTGIYGLAPTGLLDGRKVTTHWRFARDVSQSFPKLRVDANALFLKDGPFYTSAGITAGKRNRASSGPRDGIPVGSRRKVGARRTGR